MCLQTKYKQSKTEANAAQNTLQKEITSLRENNRTLQLRLRDIEVANDDFERQARNTSSSLEDMESKFNVAIERAVMMEEEIRIGEQEREGLRIETQRLRDELSDLKIEAEILQGKLKMQATRKLPGISTDYTLASSPAYHGSPASTTSSPFVSTPPDTKSVSTTGTVSETPTPPSPPISEASAKARKPISARTPINRPSKIRTPSAGLSTTPKQRFSSVSRPMPRTRGPTLATSTRATPGLRSSINKAGPSRGLPNSTSLTHIRSLTAQMQRLEQRVQSARSKLPAPVNTPPKASPRGSTLTGTLTHFPASVTIRSRKRTGGSSASIASSITDETPLPMKHINRISTSGISRLSFGTSTSRESREGGDNSRPSSRASTSGFVRPPSRTDSSRPLSRTEFGRPSSRASMSGAKTPLGHYSQNSLADARRPRSSVGGNYAAAHGHGQSQSISHIDLDELREMEFTTPSRRNTLARSEADGSAIPVPGSIARRQSSGSQTPAANRRPSIGMMRESERTLPFGRTRKLSGVGETY